MSSNIVLFDRIEDCCGCGACLNICPRNAITMEEDECGFIYPVIDGAKCVACGQCKKVCSFQNEHAYKSPIECYAAVNNDKNQIKDSASGGVFAALAKAIIKDGGIVFGAAFAEDWSVHHVSAENIEQLRSIQGSKYVHSNTEKTYSEAKMHLKTGRKVLFSGTPCQIDGLYGFLGCDYDNLVTVDVVCHGVPSNRMFLDYLDGLEKKYRGKATFFSFRDKSIGWGINGSIIINQRKIKIWQSASPYLYYFSKGWNYRENCYKCKYACQNRPADISLGDYWGIEKQHPELLKRGWDENDGISCVMLNSIKAMRLFAEVDCECQSTTIEKISSGNAQLSRPCGEGKRSEIIGEYRDNGWNGLEKRFNDRIGLMRFSSAIKNRLPVRLKRKIKMLRKRD